MDYKEKYNEALERAKKLYEQGTITESLGFVFPELAEGDDERIRKAIHIYLDWLDGRKDYQPKGVYTIRDMIDWVIKQDKKISVDKVIEWMRVKAPKWLYDTTYPIRLDVDAEVLIKQFKKDFGL